MVWYVVVALCMLCFVAGWGFGRWEVTKALSYLKEEIEEQSKALLTMAKTIRMLGRRKR